MHRGVRLRWATERRITPPIGRCCWRRGQAEVDLFFERVDFGDLDFDAVAEANDTAGAAAHEVVAGGFENKEVVHEG